MAASPALAGVAPSAVAPVMPGRKSMANPYIENASGGQKQKHSPAKNIRKIDMSDVIKSAGVLTTDENYQLPESLLKHMKGQRESQIIYENQCFPWVALPNVVGITGALGLICQTL